jgi:hypothetical protein
MRVKCRASSLPIFFDCANLWRALHIALTPGTPSSAPQHLGSALHAPTGLLDAQRMGGTVIWDEVTGVLLEFIRDTSRANLSGRDLETLESIGLRALAVYDIEISQKMDWVGVEVVCEPLLIEVPGTDVEIEFTGVIDRIYRAAPSVHGVLDLKTGEQAVTLDGCVDVDFHAYQLACYELLAYMAETNTGLAIRAPTMLAVLSTCWAQRDALPHMCNYPGISNIHI